MKILDENVKNSFFIFDRLFVWKRFVSLRVLGISQSLKIAIRSCDRHRTDTKQTNKQTNKKKKTNKREMAHRQKNKTK